MGPKTAQEVDSDILSAIIGFSDQNLIWVALKSLFLAMCQSISEKLVGLLVDWLIGRPMGRSRPGKNLSFFTPVYSQSGEFDVISM